MERIQNKLINLKHFYKFEIEKFNSYTKSEYKYVIVGYLTSGKFPESEYIYGFTNIEDAEKYLDKIRAKLEKK